MSLLSQPETIRYIESRTGRAGIISPITLKRWRASQKGPSFVRVEGRVYYPRESLDLWLEEIGLPATDSAA